VSVVETAVGAVVLHDGQMLLVRRGNEPSEGTWAVPGGRVEYGETLHEAVVREVREETGVDVAVDRFLGFVERLGDAPEGGGDSPHFVILDFSAVPLEPSPVPVAGDDALEAAWFDVEDVAELELAEGLADFLIDVGVITPTRPLDL
jgi:8-oxo-dGTP diphosphatase